MVESWLQRCSSQQILDNLDPGLGRSRISCRSARETAVVLGFLPYSHTFRRPTPLSLRSAVQIGTLGAASRGRDLPAV